MSLSKSRRVQVASLVTEEQLSVRKDLAENNWYCKTPLAKHKSGYIKCCMTLKCERFSACFLFSPMLNLSCKQRLMLSWINNLSKMPSVTLKIGSESLQHNKCLSLLLGNDDWSNFRFIFFSIALVLIHTAIWYFLGIANWHLLWQAPHMYFYPHLPKALCLFSLATRKYITVH